MEEYMERKFTDKEIRMSARLLLNIAEVAGDDEEEIEEYRQMLGERFDNAIFNLTSIRDKILEKKDV